MRPVDPRLLRRSATVRGYVAATGGLAVVLGGLVVAQALLLAGVVAPVAVSDAGLPDVAPALAGLAAVLAGRAGVAWVQERLASRAHLAAVAELRGAVVARALARPSRTGDGADGDPAGVTALVTSGLAGLEAYLGRFLPQLIAAAVVTPAALLVVAGLDPLAALTLAVVVPLVPLFMALVGWTTRTLAADRLARMQRLGTQVLDLVAGLGTLRALGRARDQARLVHELGERHRSATMRALRVAFLSAFVLELLTTIGVALVAVGVGFRLAYGQLDLATGLAVLVLAPEVLAPLRRVGTEFHAGADGLAALDRALGLVEPRDAAGAGAPGPGAPAVRGRVPDLATEEVSVRGFAVRDRHGDLSSPIDLDLAPGEVVALAGPSGCGKSSLLLALLGLLPCDGSAARGSLTVGGSPISDLDLDALHRQVAWLPQHPALLPGTVLENVTAWRADAVGGDVTAADVTSAAWAAGLDEVVAELPAGWATRVGTGGHGLSAGQRQRLALARVRLRPARLLLLDEPTAHLDAGTEQRVARLIAEARRDGRTVLVVSHRLSLQALADRTVEVAPQGPGATARPGAGRAVLEPA
ncbi:MAG: thiol reductant ABC exporter subunit CydD [Kineosporiaceae bacterium]